MSMFEKKSGKSKSESMSQLLNSILCDIAGCEDGNLDNAIAPKAEDMASATFTASEIPVAKVHGVRSQKSCLWLGRIETPTELLTALVSTGPVAHLSAWLLEGQRLKTWLHSDPSQRPLVNLVTARFSPASGCIDELASLLQSGISGELELFDGAQSAIHGAFSFDPKLDHHSHSHSLSVCV